VGVCSKIFYHYLVAMTMNAFRLAGDGCNQVSVVFLLCIVVWKGNAAGSCDHESQMNWFVD
jgi:hypothetical protein